MTPTLLIWIFFISLFAGLFFSTVSYSLRMMSRAQLEQALFRHKRSAALEHILSRRYDVALTASVLRLAANATAMIAVVWYLLRDDGTHAAPHPLRMFSWTIVLTVPALIIFSVAIPQAWAKYAGESLLATVWPGLRLIHFILWPLVRVLNIFDEIVRRLSGVSIADDPDNAVEAAQQEILSVVNEGTAEGAVDEEQKKMIQGVISFRDLQVGQIMTPRTEIVAVDVSSPIAEVTTRTLKEGLSRVPVYEGSLDNIVGILYAKDLLNLLSTTATGAHSELRTQNSELRTLMRPPYFVPRTKPLRDLLREFRLQQVHMAIVLDEYGGTSGLVTTEDIVEEIVGDIADEYENPPPPELKRLEDRVVEVDARMNISDLNRELGLSLAEDGDYHTIGGLVLSMLGYIPAKGEKLAHGAINITVLECEPRRIKKLRLDLPEFQLTAEEQAAQDVDI